MKALENRAIFSGHFDHDRQMRIHRDRLKNIKHVVNTKEPESIHNRCSSPSKQLMTKHAERDRVMNENLKLAQKIFNIMEGEGEITQMVNDTRHIDNHPGTMNFRQRLQEAQKVHARNMLLAARLDTVKPYYKMNDLKVVKPIKKIRMKKKRHKQSRLTKELEYAIHMEQHQHDDDDEMNHITPRSEGRSKVNRAFKFKDIENNGSLSARAADGTSSAPIGKSRPTNILLEYTKIQEGRVLDVAVLKEPFRDRYAIFGIDVDDGQKYELRLSSDDVSNILDGDILVTSVDNIEVWMALLNKVSLKKVNQFSALSSDMKEKSAARSYDSIPQSERSKPLNNNPRRNASDTQFGGRVDLSDDQPNYPVSGMMPVRPTNSRPSAERPASRNAGSARGRGSRVVSRSSANNDDDAMIMDAPVDNPYDTQYGPSRGTPEGINREPQVPKSIPEEGEEEVSPQQLRKPIDVPAKPIKYTPTKPKGHPEGQKGRGSKKFTTGYRSSRSERKQSASPRVTATKIDETDEGESQVIKPKPPTVAMNKNITAEGKGKMKAKPSAPPTNKNNIPPKCGTADRSPRDTEDSKIDAVNRPKVVAKNSTDAKQRTGVEVKRDSKSQQGSKSVNSSSASKKTPLSAERKKRVIQMCETAAQEAVSDAVDMAISNVVETINYSEKSGSEKSNEIRLAAACTEQPTVIHSTEKKRIVTKLKSGKTYATFGLRRCDEKPLKLSSFFSFLTNDSLPSSVDLRKYCSEIEDQSETMSCCANAVVGAYEYLCKRAAIQSGDTPGDISRLFVYYVGRLRDKQLFYDPSPLADDGLSLAGAIDALTIKGACLKSTWDFDLNNINTEPPPSAYEEAMRYKIASAEPVPVDLTAMKSALAKGLPIIFGLKITSKFLSTGRSGYVSTPSPTDPQAADHGEHCMLIVGYSNALNCFIVRNSWGKEWGDQGYCYIPYDYCTNPDYNYNGQYVIKDLTDTDFTPEEEDTCEVKPIDSFDIDDIAEEIEIIKESIEQNDLQIDLKRIYHIFDMKSEARRVFNKIDYNKNGTISTKELRSALHLNGTFISTEEVKKIQQQYDEDADGLISFEEFLKIPGVLQIKTKESLYDLNNNISFDDSSSKKYDAVPVQDVMRQVGASVDSAASTVNVSEREQQQNIDTKATDSTPDVPIDELQEYSSELFEAESEASPVH